MTLEAFLAKIQRFCVKYDMAPSSFGRMAVNDGNFIQEIADGTRSPTMRTVNTVLLFMERYANEQRNKPATRSGYHAKK